MRQLQAELAVARQHALLVEQAGRGRRREVEKLQKEVCGGGLQRDYHLLRRGNDRIATGKRKMTIYNAEHGNMVLTLPCTAVPLGGAVQGRRA